MSGKRISFAYLLPESAAEPQYPSKEQQIYCFLQIFKRNQPTFSPNIFPDKDWRQLNFIAKVFHINSSLCYWHLRQAIKRKIAALRSEGLSRLNANLEGTLSTNIYKHYFKGPYCSVPSVEALRAQTVTELTSSLCGCVEKAMLHYLLWFWYGLKEWMTWGRRHERVISFPKQLCKVSHTGVYSNSSTYFISIGHALIF